MAGFSEGIKVFFGGDTTQLRASLSEANVLVDSFAKGIKKSGIDLGKGFGLGILITQFRQLGQEAIEQAQKARDEWEKTGKPIDAATKSLASFGDGLKAVKQGAVDAVGFLLSGYTQLGELIGSTINRIRGIDEATENNMENIARETEKTLARIAEARKKYEADNTPEKLAEREKKALEQRMKDWDAYLKEQSDKQMALIEKIKKEDENALKIEQELHDKKIKHLEDNREMIILEAKQLSGLTEEEGKRLKVLQLQAQQKGINLQIDTILLKGVANLTREDRAKLAVLTRQNEVIDTQIKGLETANAAIAKAVPLIQSNIDKWKEFVGIITSTGKGNKDLTDRELARKIATTRQDIFQRQASSPYEPDFFLSPQRLNLSNALNEQNLRRDVRGRAAAFGEDAAFKQFGGLSEQRFEEILKKTTDESVQTRTLKNIEEALTRRGILTFPSKNPPTGP